MDKRVIDEVASAAIAAARAKAAELAPDDVLEAEARGLALAAEAEVRTMLIVEALGPELASRFAQMLRAERVDEMMQEAERIIGEE